MFKIDKNANNYENKTLRLRVDIIKKLNDLAAKNNISFNRVASQCIEYALQHLEDENEDKSD